MKTREVTHFPEWFDSPDRACKGVDPNVFFAADDRDSKDSIENTLVKAVKLCEMCPFRAKCLEFALKNDERYGVWGATSASMRRQIKRCRAGACRHVKHRRG